MRASDRVYRTLLEEIQGGVLAPGQVLVEVEQSARLGVSRTPVREALARLIAAGLAVQQSPRMIVVSRLDEAGIRALFQLRRALEGEAVRLVAGGTGAVRHRFHQLAAEFADYEIAAHEFTRHRPEDADQVDAYYRLIARFDAAIDESVHNDYLRQALQSNRTHLVRVRSLARDNPARLGATAGEHRLIAEAIVAGDGELAGHATHVHLHNALTSILSALKDQHRTETEGAA